MLRTLSLRRFTLPEVSPAYKPSRIFRTLIVDGDSEFVSHLGKELGKMPMPDGDRFEVCTDKKAPLYDVILLGEHLPDSTGTGIRPYAEDRKLMAQLKRRNPKAFFFHLVSHLPAGDQDGGMRVIGRRLDPKRTVEAVCNSLQRLLPHLKAS